MPLVHLETRVNPPDLLRQFEPTGESRWWVIHTRPRAEKALVQRLLARELSYYLPLHNRQWRSRGRLLSSQLPLFPGYVFLHGDPLARQLTLETNLAVRILDVPDQARLYGDLMRVEQLIATGVPLSPEQRLLDPGSQVEITAGPLMGLTGKVLRRGKQLNFVVEVDFLRQGVSVELQAWMIQPCSTARALAETMH
jgi:transcriptional antiterminator RfaH